MRRLMLAATAALGMTGSAEAALYRFDFHPTETFDYACNRACPGVPSEEHLSAWFVFDLPSLTNLFIYGVYDSVADVAAAGMVSSYFPEEDALAPGSIFDFSIETDGEAKLISFGAILFVVSREFNYENYSSSLGGVTYVAPWDDLLPWTVSYGSWTITEVTPAAVPIPAAGLLLPAAGGALALLRRRRG